jgi:GNAT superfamily N-acetyltransferase
MAVQALVATPDRLPEVADLLAGAFHDDPVWSWAFPDPVHRRDHLRAFWGLMLEGAAGYGWIWATDGLEAATLWIPPGQPELAEPWESQVEPLVHELVGTRAAEVLGALECFDSAHPRDEDHFYLSLLGTHPERRGGGMGMALLRDNLARIDAQGRPAYLESSNPANLGRYESLGFVPIGEFELPGDGPNVTRMWREPA